MHAHMYHYTTEIKIQVIKLISNACKDTMVQFKPGLLISSPEELYRTSRR